MTMEVMAMEPESLRKLVRRDLVVVCAGSLIAIWTYSLVAAVAFGTMSELTAGRVEVAIAVIVSVFCVWWWASGPPGLMRDRMMVLIPVFLIAGPGLIGVHNLGGGLIVAAALGCGGLRSRLHAGADVGLPQARRALLIASTARIPAPDGCPKYVYSMHRCNKFFGPERQVLRDISLSFLPGAKIGVLGPNGAGKSTLWVMAGLDEPSNGTARSRPARRSAICRRSRSSTRPRTCAETSRTAWPRSARCWTASTRSPLQFAEPMADDEMTALLEEQGEVQDRIERPDAWNLDRMIDTAMDALRLPPGDADVANLSGGERRRVALCRLLLSSPDLLLLDEPTNHLDADSVAWLEQLLEEFPGHGAGRHPRSLLPGQRGRLDPGARPRPRHPLPGQLHLVAGAEAGTAGGRGEAGVGPPAHAGPRARVGADVAARAPGQVQGARGGLRAAAGRRGGSQARHGRDPHPGRRPPSATWWSRPRPAQGLRRPAADRGSQLLAAAGRHRRRDRSQRRRQDHAVSHDRRPGAARLRHAARSATPSRSPTSTRPAPISTRPTRCGRRSPAAAT